MQARPLVPLWEVAARAAVVCASLLSGVWWLSGIAALVCSMMAGAHVGLLAALLYRPPPHPPSRAELIGAILARPAGRVTAMMAIDAAVFACLLVDWSATALIWAGATGFELYAVEQFRRERERRARPPQGGA